MRRQNVSKRTSAIAKATGTRKPQKRRVSKSYRPATVSIEGVFARALSGLKSIALAVLALAMLEETMEMGNAQEEGVSEGARITRVWTLSVLALLTACGLTYRLVSLQGVEHDRWLNIASKQHQTSITIQGARGNIFDSFGRTLAASVPAVSLALHPRQIKEKSSTVEALAKVLGEESVLQEAVESKKNFVWISRGLEYEKKEQIEKLNLRGVSVFDEFKRVYPEQKATSTLVGLVGTDGFGLSGLEQQFNEQLQAHQHTIALRRDARGNFVSLPTSVESSAHGLLSSFTNFSLIKNAEAAENTRASIRQQGSDLRVSIDSVIQGIVEREFSSAKQSTGAKEVYGLVMDAESGQIMAMAQSSNFDPNGSSRPSPAKLRNMVIQNSFEPGSTMKPLVAAAALDAGVVKKGELLDCEEGRWRFGRHTIRDVHPIGVVPLSEVIIQSSNVCMAKIGARLGKKRLRDALKNFGFGEQSGIELPGETKGILRSEKRWKKVDIATHSFGQGVAVSALQMVQAFATLANGGLLVQPSILLAPSGQAKVKRRVFTPETAETMSKYLQGVTEGEHGTGKAARVSGLTVYGKTGTAQKARVDGRGYDPDKVLSSFIGYVHGNEIGVDRSLVMLVVVDEPSVSPRWGGRLAGPVFRRSMERIFSHLLTQEGSA